MAETLKCVRCVVDQQVHIVTGQSSDAPPVRAAVLVYKGESLCDGHFNTVRGHDWFYGTERAKGLG